MNYQEHITPGPSDTESGWMPGFTLQGSYLNAANHGIYGDVQYGYSSGGITYHGAILGTDKPITGTDSATIQYLMTKLGYSMDFSGNELIPYVAAGWQHWSRNITANGATPTDEGYESGLIGAGLLYQYACTPRLVSSVDAEFLAVVGGSMTPKVDDGALGTASFDTSGEEKISVTENYRISGPWHVFAGLQFTHFNYTGGSLRYGYYEPSSATNIFDVNTGISYSF